MPRNLSGEHYRERDQRYVFCGGLIRSHELGGLWTRIVQPGIRVGFPRRHYDGHVF